MRYKETDKPLTEIAEELNVDVLVEGSAQRVGDSVRIMAQLIDPETEQALWAESYERDLENVLLLWSEVAQAIAGEVQVALTPEETMRLAGARPVNPEAHDAYLNGTYHWNKLNPEEIDTAERYFELALEKDPSYAPAYAGLAWVWAARQQMQLTLPRLAGPKARAAALRAVELDDLSAVAHEALAVVRAWTDWDWALAEQEFQRSLELDPNFANALAYYAHFLAVMGRLDDAILHSKRALELDPFNALYHGMYSMVLEHARLYDDAIAAARTALAMQPSLGMARNALQHALVSKGIRNEMLEIQRDRIARDPERVAAFEQGLAEAGYEGAFRRIADLHAARYEKAGGIPDPGERSSAASWRGRIFMPAAIAWRYIYAGDYDRAMDWLEEAYEIHHPHMPYIGTKPLYDPLRSDPRFQDLLRRMNLPSISDRSEPDVDG
jgi:tetratricopeptide (TPR) repeat protein